MTDDSKDSATKGDLRQFKDELSSRMDGMNSRFDTIDSRIDSMDGHIDSLSSRMDSMKTELCAYMEDMKDQILRGFGLTEENIRKDCAHVDEVAALDTRLTRVEQQLVIHD